MALMSVEHAFSLWQRDEALFIDATWRMEGGDASADYAGRHIPGAHFFGVDAISEPHATLPHMMPSPARFASGIAHMGVGTKPYTILYDDSPQRSAARVWWTFHAMGVNAAVLNGGLHAWAAAGHPLTDEVVASVASTVSPAPLHGAIASLDDVRAASARDDVLIVDARPAPRFLGEAPEPRSGLRRGCIPGSKNIPFTDLYTNGYMHPAEKLQSLFAPLEPKRYARLIASCGSGVTACSLLLALSTIGCKQLSLYDGSWAEWGSFPAESR